MTIVEAINFYHSLERFGIKPGLERIKKLAEKIGSPHKRLKFIHVAGTNGKGSVCTALASVLTKAGYKTGLYTSPYVIDFRERIQYCMKMITADELVSVTETVKLALETLAANNITITEFEAVTAAAMLYFAKKRCDYAVLETGLGGRFDATNIISASVCSIITSVSFDHMHILGDTLSEITFEKCGIIKNNCPVITGEEQPHEVLAVIKTQAEKKNARLCTVGADKTIHVINEDITGAYADSAYGRFTIPFAGKHQINNMALVLAAVDEIRKTGADISDSAVCRGISTAKIPARIEILSKNPLVILDGSHNCGSTAALAEVLKKFLSSKKIIAVIGMMADKDCVNSMSNLMPCFDEVITVKPSNPRSLDADKLALIAKNLGVAACSYDSPKAGVKKAFEKLNNFDALVVCGSLYLAGDVRNYLVEICGEIPQLNS